jgi:2-oxoglutarate/2-oxoacid ferredoxin oxidoreductase subunit beta
MSEQDFNYAGETAWCPGCGNFGILNVVKKALQELNLDPKKTVLVSGIGQAAKTPQYVNANFFNGLHGRAFGPAVSIKAVNPELNVIITSGDGDMYGEGGNHFIHNIRRNPNVTVIVHNNMVYGLTKGQASPTTGKGMKTPVQTTGVVLEPFNPIATAISLDASFVARASIHDLAKTKEIIKQAINHKGFALVDLFQPCVVFNKINTYEWFRNNTYYLEENFNPKDKGWAFAKAIETEKFPLGIFYLAPEKPTFEELVGVHEKNSAPLFERTLNKEKLQELLGEKKTLHRFSTKIIKVIQETSNVKTFVMERPQGFMYEAGQYAMIGFEDKRKINNKINIPLTFTSCPSEENLKITMKKYAGFSQEIYNLKEQDTLLIQGPLGRCFNIDEFEEDELVLIAGGTGITPFISIINYMNNKNMNNKVTLINANKTFEDVIMKEFLEKIKKQENIKLVNVLEQPHNDWNEETGFITKEIIQKHVPLKNQKWMMCGPPVMVENIKKIVQELKVPEEKICIDDWQK